MKELKVSDLTKIYGDKTLFDQISFLIHEKDRIGLIGVNGTGKTSLLNILSGREKGDGEQQTVFHPVDYRIGYLSQATSFHPNQTILDAVFQGDSVQLQTVRRYEEALLVLEQDGASERAQRAYSLAEEAMNEQDAWQTDTNAKIILHKLGIKELNKQISELSGGQEKRVALAQILIEEPDLLLLDEPTNHLDYEAIQWLEGYLKQYRGSLLMVTHDRYFLDRVTNRMFELSFGRLHEYQGNYEAYVLARAERERVAGEQEQKRKQLYKKELSWMRAGVQARGTKQQARINRFDELKDTLQQVKTNGEVEIDIAAKRLGKKVLEIKTGKFSIDDKKILDQFDLLIQSNERLGITGENGAGKSTLLNILAGRLPLQSGELIVGETVRIAYYTQQNEDLNGDQRMIAYLQETAEEVRRKDGTQVSVAEILEQFLFPRFMHGTKISKLSGGEKRRLFLLKLLISQPNVLLLDEPTNDLDIDTLTILEDYLHSFPGAVVTVSHDRYFLDKVTNKLLIFEGDGIITSYFGSINDFLATQAKELSTSKVKTETKPVEKPIKKKMSYLEKQEWETIEETIMALEDQVALLKEEMNHQGDNFSRLQELQEEVVAFETKLEEKMLRWEYLSEWAES